MVQNLFNKFTIIYNHVYNMMVSWLYEISSLKSLENHWQRFRMTNNITARREAGVRQLCPDPSAGRRSVWKLVGRQVEEVVEETGGPDW